MKGHHFSEVTENNKAGMIWVISLLGLVYSILALLTRAFIKWRLLGLEDLSLIVAQLLAFGQYGILFASLHHGLGRSSDLLDSQSRIMTAMISQILLILSLGLTKCSVISLIRRVFTRDMMHSWLICDIILGFVCIWTIASTVVVSAGCNLSNYIPPDGNRTCSGFTTRWLVVTTLDVVSELLLFVLPIYFLWTLQMSIRLKARVVIAFSFRLPITAFAIIFVHLFTAIEKNPNRGAAISTAIVWQQIQISYSLISATIPCLKSFISSFDTKFGMGDGSGQGQYNYGSNLSQPNQNSRNHHLSYNQSKSAKASSSQAAIELHPLRARYPESLRNESKTADKERKSFAISKLRPERLKGSSTMSVGMVPG
ncbi:hypothetical protein B0J11DRAFT_459762, partial [Dendryphion nanum]